MAATIGYYQTAAWNGWASTAGTTVTATTSIHNNAWMIWYDQGTTGTCSVAATITGTAWTNWASNAPAVLYAPVQRTAEQIAADLERRRVADAEWQAKEKEQREKREAANRRALLLLMAVLNEAQRKEYREKKHFHVTSQSGRRYRIDHGSHGNLKLVDAKGKVLKSLCVQPNHIPIPDVLAAQALHLMHNEEEIVRTSNITDEVTRKQVRGSMEALAA